MTRDDIIRMAREAGIEFDPRWGTCYTGNVQLERFAALVAAAAVEREREACAKVCEQEWNKYCVEPSGYALAVNECAAAIRARSKQ